MTIPNPTCVSVDAPPAALRIRLPGGMAIEGIPDLSAGVVTQLASAQALLAGLIPAMAGFQPMFLIIDAMTKVMAVFGAIPGLIAGNVVGFYSALNDAAEAVFALVQLQPAVSLPLMLQDMFAAMAVILRALKDEVTSLQALSAQGDAVIAAAQAAGDTAQEAVGNCMKANADALGAHVVASLGPLEQILEMATQLAGLMPSPPALPSFGDVSGMDLDALASFLDTMIQTFEAIRIPGA